jgi:hypothetical protein
MVTAGEDPARSSGAKTRTAVAFIATGPPGRAPSTSATWSGARERS